MIWQKNIIKAGVSDKYFCAAAMVFKEEGKPKKYQGLLLCREKGKEFAKYADTITLLESGILTDNELESLARKFKNNITMMRMVGRYAGMRNTDIMKKLTYKIEHLGLDGEAELKIFDNAKVVGNRTIDPRDRALVKVSRKYFDKGMQDAIDGLNGMVVKPGILQY